MVRRFLMAMLLFALPVPCAPAQTTSPATPSKVKAEPFLGLYFAPVPAILYDHLPRLPRGSCVVVDRVKAASPAEQAGLKTHDILISYNGTAIKDADHFAGLVRADQGDAAAPLVLLRAGKEITVPINLTTACKLADRDNARHPRSSAKKGRPPAVNVEATALANGKLEVTFEFYPEGKSKLQRVKYAGSLDEIALQVRNLPMPVQDLAKVALDRLRTRKYR